MASYNWSMTMVGYRQHQRGAAAVVGTSHMSTHEVMRFAEEMQFYTGWLLSQGAQSQLEGVSSGTCTWVAVAELFADRRIVKTEGVTSGSLTFVSAVPAIGPPPADRPVTQWADEHALPWVEIIDNEAAYWGGLDDRKIDRLLAWFLGQRPMEQDWRAAAIETSAATRLRHGLFEHGWTRNLELARAGRKPQLDLWGGVHRSCILDHRHVPAPSQVGSGLRLTLSGATWSAKEISDRCILEDQTGKLPLGR